MSKQITLNSIECSVIRAALEDYWHNTLKALDPVSPFAIERKEACRELILDLGGRDRAAKA